MNELLSLQEVLRRSLFLGSIGKGAMKMLQTVWEIMKASTVGTVKIIFGIIGSWF